MKANIKLTREELTELLNIANGFINLEDDNQTFLSAEVEDDVIVMQDPLEYDKRYVFDNAEVDEDGNLFLYREDYWLTMPGKSMPTRQKDMFVVLKYIRADIVLSGKI